MLGSADAPAHCPYRRAMDLLQRLAPAKMRVGFLLGAGCPLAVRTEREGTTSPLIPDTVGLTRQVKAHLDADATLNAAAKSLWDRLHGRCFCYVGRDDRDLLEADRKLGCRKAAPSRNHFINSDRLESSKGRSSKSVELR